MITQVTQEQREYAKTLARQVCEKMAKNGWVDNPFNKAHDRFYADYIGFLGETIFADIYHFPRPEFTTNYKDCYDFLINEKKCDLKTTNEGKTMCINFDRYNKQKNKTDIYIFSELYGQYYNVIGWCGYDELPFKANLKLFTNGLKNYVIKKTKLRKIEELI